MEALFSFGWRGLTPKIPVNHGLAIDPLIAISTSIVELACRLWGTIPCSPPVLWSILQPEMLKVRALNKNNGRISGRRMRDSLGTYCT